MFLLNTSLSRLASGMPWSSMAERIDCIDATKLLKINARKTSRSGIENPDAWSNFICLITVVFPASPAPIHFEIEKIMRAQRNRCISERSSKDT